MAEMSDVTQILKTLEKDNLNAASQLLPLVYEELRKLAAARMALEKPGQTLQPTALVHEAYLRLVRPESDIQWNSRRHFFGAAAEAMRRILVECARRKTSVKHGAICENVEMECVASETLHGPEELLGVHEALDNLAAEDDLTAQLVKLHYFAGFSIEEAAESLGMSRATAYRSWTYGKAWLRAALLEKS